MKLSLIFLTLPSIICGALHFWNYKLNYLNDYTGWGASKLLGPTLLFSQVALLATFGESYFCGYCFSKAKSSSFLYPGIGYALMTFPSAVIGRLFNTFEERLAELVIYIIGLTLVVSGLLQGTLYK